MSVKRKHAMAAMRGWLSACFPIIALLASLSLSSCGGDDDVAPEPQEEESQGVPEFSFETYTGATTPLPYRKGVMGKAPATGRALVLYLHGGSAKGDDNTSPMQEKGVDAIATYMAQRGMDAIILVPQCPKDKSWGAPLAATLKSLVDQYVDSGAADSHRLYIMGGSMGGTGTWYMLSAYPQLFAAAMPVAGDPSRCDAARVAQTPAYTVMGTADTIMDSDTVEAFVDSMKALGAECQCDVESGWTHQQTCESSYTDSRLDWLFAHKR